MNKAIYMRDIDGFASDVTLFKKIQTLGGTDGVWKDTSNDDLEEIATMYFVHSANKRLSPICRLYNENAVDLDAFTSRVAKSMYIRFGANWKKVYDAYFKTDYKPLENYDMEEVSTPRVETTTESNTATDLINSQKGDIYGFNSSDPVPSNENEITTSGDFDKNHSKSVVSRDGTDTLTRHGNIGVMSSQKLLSEETEVRKLDYWEKVFCDIDRVLCFIIESV